MLWKTLLPRRCAHGFAPGGLQLLRALDGHGRRVQHCAPRLIVLGKQWRCLLEKANSDLAPVMRHCSASATFFLKGCPSPIVSAPSLFVLVGLRVANASIMNEQERVMRANFGWRDFRELSVIQGHLFHSVSRLQHSGKVGVLVSVVYSHVVSMVLLFSVSSKTLNKELTDVDV